MASRLMLLILISTISFLAANQPQAQAEEQRKLVHKRPPPPPIDLNPPKTSERNTHDGDRGSEQMHQAANDAFEVIGAAGFGSTKISYNGDAAPRTSAQISEVVEGLGAEYGFTHEISAGAALVYNSGWANISPSSAGPNAHSYGLSDPSIYVKGRLDYDSSSLRLGGRMNFSLAKSYIDSNGNGNYYSGGVSLSPLVGYEYYYSEHTFGAKLTYQAYLGNRSQTRLTPSAEVTTDLSGGNSLGLTLFYEYDYYPMKIGMDFVATYLDGTTESYNGTIVTSGSSSTVYEFEVYAPIILTNAFTLIPKASFGWAGSYGQVSSLSEWVAGATARYAF